MSLKSFKLKDQAGSERLLWIHRRQAHTVSITFVLLYSNRDKLFHIEVSMQSDTIIIVTLVYNFLEIGDSQLISGF